MLETGEIDDWLEALAEDTLLVKRIADDVTSACYQPCRATVETLYGSKAGPLADYARTLADFDDAQGLVSTFPLQTTMSGSFLQPKHPEVSSICFEIADLVSPEDADAAVAIFESLPRGFVNDWRFGLGLLAINRPVLHALRSIRRERRAGRPQESLVISPRQTTHIRDDGYVLNLDEFDKLRRALHRIQSGHQKASLIERNVIAHNAMLSGLDAAAYPPESAPYKPDTIFKIIGSRAQQPRLSRTDRSALVAAVESRAAALSREEPELLAGLQRKVRIASIDALIERFGTLLDRPTSLERDWQKLLCENPFLLSLVFGYPVALVAAQANVGGIRLDGSGARYADFLLKNEVTHSAALVELKRPSTPLVRTSEYAGTPNISSDLVNAVMQVLDQRFRLLTNLPVTANNNRDQRVEGWFVTCVVIAGRTPSADPQAKAFEIFRNSLKDVFVITFDELLGRLVGLRALLESERHAVEQPAGAVAGRGEDDAPSGPDPVALSV